MWPDPGDALSRTIEAESAIADLYAEALRRWAPDAAAAVIPTLAGTLVNGDPALIAATLPPNPDGLAQTQSVWDAHAEEIIVAGLAILWAVAAYEALSDLNPVSVVEAVTPDVSTVVLGIVLASLLMPRHDVMAAVGHVEASPALSAARDDFLASRRDEISRTPFAVQAKVEAALSAMTREVETEVPGPSADPSAGPGAAAPDAGGGVQVTVTVIPEDRPEILRPRAAEVLNPASPQMRDLARHEGYQAAGVMNHAVLAAAVQAQAENAAEGVDEELQKTWISTLDGKTRPTHWASDGARVPLAGTFTVGADQLRFPGDPTGSPAEVKNCRCRLGILATDELLPDEVDRHTERLDGRDSVVINRDGRTQAEEIERRAAEGNVRARDTDDGVGTVASAGWTGSSEEHDMGNEDTSAETFLTFSGYIGKLGVSTSDRRILAADIDLTMREFPHPMAWQKQASGGHYDSFTVGVVEEARIDGDRVWASGYFLNSPEADEAADQVAHKVSAPSLDLAAAEYIYTDEDGKEIEGDLFDWWEENGEPFAYFTAAEVTGFTLVQTPAFDGIDIQLGERETRDLEVVAAVVASVGGPRVKTYDPALFEDPKLTRATAPTMNNETGRIYGHLAEWGHKIRGGNGELTPRNRNEYANFHTSQVQLDNGKQLSVGRLTVKGGHAPTQRGVTVATARAHYDNVCAAFGLVRVGEDEFGIWFSGVPAPGVDPDTFQQGMTAPLSGDWRDEGRGLDMIAAHAVNSPGFPIYSAVTGPDGRDLALVASLGPSRRSKSQKAEDAFSMDRESLKTLLTEVVETVDQRHADRAAALAHETRAVSLASRARDAVGDPPPEPTHEDRVGALLERV